MVLRGEAERVRRPSVGLPALYAVDSLPLKYKTEVYRRYPDLKAQAESKPFVESIEPDGAALDFYQRHQFGDGKYLPTDKQTEYANNAAVLNAFRLVLERSDSQHRKQSKRCISKAEFWRKAAQALPRIADTFPHTLPENPRRLQEKFNQYVREGYGALITGKYGTRNAAKIDDDTKESLLIRLISDARNLDNAQIARIYNIVAETQGWKTITGAAVGVWREKHDLVTAGGRLGETRFRNQRSMQVKRSRPTGSALILDNGRLGVRVALPKDRGKERAYYHHLHASPHGCYCSRPLYQLSGRLCDRRTGDPRTYQSSPPECCEPHRRAFRTPLLLESNTE